MLRTLLLLLSLSLLIGCPPAGGDDDDSAAGDDDDSAAGDDDDATGDDDDATGDDDDSAGDDDDATGDDDDSAGDDDDSTSAVFAPTAGDYDYGLINFSVNECAAGQSNIGDGVEVLNVNGDNETYQMQSTDAGVPTIYCYYDQTQAFVCDGTTSSNNLAPIGLPQATIARTDTNSGGTWTSTTTVEINNSITMNCSGSQCTVAASVLGIAAFPCTATYSTTATLIE